MKYEIRNCPGESNPSIRWFRVYEKASDRPLDHWRYLDTFKTHTEAREFVLALPVVVRPAFVVEELEL
jgi:hypothetical protein